MSGTATQTKSRFHGMKVGPEFNMHEFHLEMQKVRRETKEDVTLKGWLGEVFGPDYNPETFYAQLGIDLKSMTVDKFLTTNDLTRWLFPEIFRDAIRIGLEYAPIYPSLITGEEKIESTGLTMPRISSPDADDVRLRDTNEGATITEGKLVTWNEKQVSVHKKARGLKQTYESIMFTPINLAAIYFEELGARLGSDLDADLIDILINGDQDDNSEAAPVIGATTANALTFTDIVRAWVRYRRIGRVSAAMLTDEADAITILSMDEFNNTAPGARPQFGGSSTPTINVSTPLPTSQDLYIHNDVPAKNIILVDPTRAVVQLTAMPLLVESEKIVSRQVNGEYVSIMTGFANVFKDGRLILDYSTNLGTNPGPSTTF